MREKLRRFPLVQAVTPGAESSGELSTVDIFVTGFAVLLQTQISVISFELRARVALHTFNPLVFPDQRITDRSVIKSLGIEADELECFAMMLFVAFVAMFRSDGPMKTGTRVNPLFDLCVTG